MLTTIELPGAGDDVFAVVVYGTLRSGQHNLSILNGLDFTITPALVEGLQLHDAGPFPYATPALGGRIVGELLTFEPHQFDAALARLDRLEGYSASGPDTACHYLRRVVTATTSDQGPVRAYIYLAGPGTPLTRMPIITSGDWLNR